jgi:outer membrane protein assembly factor BamA
MTRLVVLLAVAVLRLGTSAQGQEAIAGGQVAVPPAAEHLAEVRIHGNHTTPDADVLRLAGLALGEPIDDAAIAAARSRLEKSGRFAEVEIRKRYRSLEPGGDVALVVVVREHPLPSDEPGSAAARPFRRLFASGMFLPILRYNDGYGFTYGARFSFVDMLGRGSRVSIPLSWGGNKQAAVEVERTFKRGPFDRVFGGASVSERTNPFYELDENRDDLWLDASRQLVKPLRVSGHGGYAWVRFGALDEQALTYGIDLTLDTRLDPVFPRNAFYASAGWERLSPTVSAGVNRFRAEGRAYRGLIGQSVVSLRAQYLGADGPQPAYARYLLGGASGLPSSGTLRGWRPGSFSGDNLLAGSLELRVPLSSPMGIGRAGFTLFADAGTAWDDGQRLADSRVQAGAGGGVFILASIFQLNLEVGFREGWGTRVHFTTGLQF